MSDIAARFARETADHKMTVLHDDGLYRHLRFQQQVWRPPLSRPLKSSFYWFDLITIPGALIFQGDGDSFHFRRVEDMFEFFRGHRVNPSYWAEKVVDGRDRLMKFDYDLYVTAIKNALADATLYGDVPAGTAEELQRQVFDEVNDYDELGAREALASFEHEGFRFYDTWEWDFHSYDWWFLWSLHAIVWGIASYDRGECVPVAPVVVDARVSGGVL